MELSDAIIKAKENNQMAFNFLLETFWNDVFGFMLIRTQNENDAEDITIETFFKAFDKINSFDPKFKFKTWLITIAKNTHLDSLRKQKNTLTNQTTEEDENRVYWIQDNAPSAEDKLITEQNLAELLKDIKKLKPHHQEIIQLRYFQEQSYQEIAKTINIPINNVKVKLLRARKLLACIIRSKNMIKFLQKLGPGLLFAGAAIGVSHLVQSTKAGANFGFGLLWALILINIVKYPFFQFGPRYATATGERVLDGYNKFGKNVLKVCALLTFATMFTIQAAVTIVTAGIASSLFGAHINMEIWTIIILSICFGLLLVGKYTLLDKMMKIIIIILSVSTLFAVITAFYNSEASSNWTQILPKTDAEIIFLIAFMGWMPAPLDVSIWHSLWAIQKRKRTKSI